MAMENTNISTVKKRMSRAKFFLKKKPIIPSKVRLPQNKDACPLLLKVPQVTPVKSDVKLPFQTARNNLQSKWLVRPFASSMSVGTNIIETMPRANKIDRAARKRKNIHCFHVQ